MVYTDIIARFKDVVIVLFFLASLQVDDWKVKRDFLRRSTFGWLLLYVIFSFPISLYSQLTPYGSAFHLPTSFGWAVYLRVIYFCVLIYCMRIYFERYPCDIGRLLKLFVNSCIVFVIFNVAAYFYHFPFMTVFRPWPGRISNGYPTADAMMLLFALVTHLVVLSRGRTVDFFVAILLICGVFANATGSGVACVSVLGIVYAVINFRKHPGRVLLYSIAAVAILMMALSLGYFLLKTYDPVDLSRLLLILQARGLEGLALVSDHATTGGGHNTGSIATRLTQFLYRSRYSENWFDQAFGLGAFYGYVENEFLHIVLVWGVAGFVLFCATMFEVVWSSARENRSLMTYWIVIWLAAGMVLITTYLFSLFVPFAILISAACARPLVGLLRNSQPVLIIAPKRGVL